MQTQKLYNALQKSNLELILQGGKADNTFCRRTISRYLLGISRKRQLQDPHPSELLQREQDPI